MGVKKLTTWGVMLLAAIFVLVVNQILVLRKAHSTFENYYTFRGCTQLVTKTDIEGKCVTKGGQTIKIVKYRNKWYLDGDLPWACIGKLCLGI